MSRSIFFFRDEKSLSSLQTLKHFVLVSLFIQTEFIFILKAFQPLVKRLSDESSGDDHSHNYFCHSSLPQKVISQSLFPA